MRPARSSRALLVLLAAFILGGLAGYSLPRSTSAPAANAPTTARHARKGWSGAFSLVRIQSTADGSEQPAYFLSAPPGTPRPLIVSLHTWSGDYAQIDPLAEKARAEGWNYIHPNFRGPNRSADACLSDKVISDLDDAVEYGQRQGRVDAANVFVVGLSGGGTRHWGTT